MIKVTVKKSGNNRFITFEGELTIENAAKIQEVLSKPFGKKEHRIISVEGATRVDLSCFQLFCSAHRAAVAENERLSIDSNRSEHFRAKTREAGFLRSEACLLNIGRDCLWTEGCNE
jgi:anti-anti-sigma regulatory factor